MSRFSANLVLTVALATLCVWATVYINRLAAPLPRVLPAQNVSDPPYDAVIRTITRESTRAELEAFAGLGSRFTGSPGANDAADYIAGSLKAMGFDEVVEQPFTVTVPVTRRAVLTTLPAAGLRHTNDKAANTQTVEIFPMLPNWFRTVTTPHEGITGTVYRGTQGLAREFTGVDLKGNIVLLPVGTPWSTVAGMGAAAVLYFDDGRRATQSGWTSTNASLDVPRFIVTGDVDAIVGKKVRIESRVDYAAVPSRNIIGVLKPRSAAGAVVTEEAVVLSAFYDSYSYAPDLAPGADQAAGPAALLATCRQLAADNADRRRAVVVLFSAAHAQALSGVREFVSALGPKEERAAVLDQLRSRVQTIKDTLVTAEAVRMIDAESEYWKITDEEGEEKFWSDKPEVLRASFVKLVSLSVQNELAMAMEDSVAARVGWVRDGQVVRTAAGEVTRAFEKYNNARIREQRINTLLASKPYAIKAAISKSPDLVPTALPEAVASLAQAEVRHARDELARVSSRLQLADRLAEYQRFLFLGFDLTTRSGRLGMVVGEPWISSWCMPADAEIAAQFSRAGERLDSALRDQLNAALVQPETAPAATQSQPASTPSTGPAIATPVAATPPPISHIKTADARPRFENLLRERETRALSFVAAPYGAPFFFDSTAIIWAGFPSFSIVTLDDDRARIGTPRDTYDAILNPSTSTASNADPVENLMVASRLAAAVSLQLARGHGQIVPISRGSDLQTIRGTVLSQIGDSLAPSSPVGGALVRFGPSLVWGSPVVTPPGIDPNFLITAGPDGRFALESVWPRAVSLEYTPTVDIDAAKVRDDTGQITWTLAMSQSGPDMAFRSQRVPMSQYRRTEATPVVFRATPVQVFPMSNPSTLRPYAAVDFLEATTLAPPRESKRESGNGALVCFVPPDSRLYFTFKEGRKDNASLLDITAFALGAADQLERMPPPDAKSEISGPGYFAADTPRILNLELDAAASLVRVNSHRVAVQKQHNMADEMVTQYQLKAAALSKEADGDADEGDIVHAKRTALDSLAYSSNIHPVIRDNASDAVLGILFYLGVLAIPFAFFVEKLMIGSTDIRWQIAWQGAIFLLFFLALRAFHPAYELVRSSLVVLLAFVTLALGLLVSGFVAAKFSSNISELNRKLQKRVEATDVSRAGAAMTAFSLGLSNLRKRPIRTGLTAGTLVLMTFVMICFTSISSDLVDIEFPLGSAPYNGLLIRDRNLGSVESALMPLRERYGENHVVAPRAWGGTFSLEGGAKVSDIARFQIVRKSGGRSHEATAYAVLGVSSLETEVTPIAKTFVALNRWIAKDTEFSCMLPRAIADQLHIDDDAVRLGMVKVEIGGQEYQVLGVFEENKFDAMLDLDGQPLTPLDVRALTVGASSGSNRVDDSETPESVPRLPSKQIIMTSIEAMPSRDRYSSVAVALKTSDLPTARTIVTSHLERTGRPAYYGLAGVSFYGGKFRLQSIKDVLDLVLPIVLSALTVLNTMRGSVYERRTELYVFNAVGLAPNHIFALFLAEACVYAVLGCVGGYLLAQFVGFAVSHLGIAAGLTLNYSSLSSVVVSVVIMVVVLLASFLPARVAAKLAAPSETMARHRHTARGDAIEIDLPFTFNRRDRVAIIPYFVDWFDQFGEASAAEFFCTPPVASVRLEQGKSGPAAAPVVTTMTWLKPYDLGVSQTVELVVRNDPRTGDNIATVVMTRKSGDRDSWERCCHAFVGLLRKRFLTWRAIAESDRAELLKRGQDLLDPSKAVNA